MSILLVLSLTAGLIAWQQFRASEHQRHEVLTAQRIALSRQLATESDGLLGTNPDLASLLAVKAYQTSPTKEATASLMAAAALPLRRRLTGYAVAVESVAFSPDGHTLASGDGDGKVRLCDAMTGKLRTTLRTPGGVESVAFSPNGRTVATGEFDGKARLWDTATGKLRTVLRTPGGVESVAFSPDGHTVAGGGFDGVRLWDATTGKVRTTLTGHTDTVESVTFSPNGHTLATGGDDGKVRLWDLATGRLRTTLTGAWRGSRPQTDPKGDSEAVESVAFSPDGHTLASGGDDNDSAVRLWDVATSGLRTTLTGHPGGVESVAFSPNGRALASGGDDGKVQLWDVSLSDPLSAMRKIYQAVHRTFTRSERSMYLAGQSSGTPA
ncbi:WD40 repeat domain-containing protein [Streptomyces glomeratus]|uniref:WD40 repeat domain-containing protein n=1 Tax=Streptomyces glomeratus TaxID=284452 RepID=UPI001F471285|nr:WD40 repeat domain-containing protein [Streptomyces glomeratus]MCF1508647.1 WD40 repeat domain-containing protein [Streptomyces glomeratus]